MSPLQIGTANKPAAIEFEDWSEELAEIAMLSAIHYQLNPPSLRMPSEQYADECRATRREYERLYMHS